jgi:alcohol sulfotransferase
MNISGYVCSFPKSGRTWLRYGLIHYFNDLLGLGFKIGFGHLRLAFNDVGRPPRHEQYGVFPNIIFSHELYTSDVGEHKSIMLVRNVLDTLVSYHHHLDADLHFDTPVFENIIDHLVDDYVRYMNDWSEHLKGMYIVNYSDLFELRCWKSILEFLGFVVDDKCLISAFEKSGFQKMSEDETVQPLNDSANANHRRVRRGKQNGWRDELTQEQADVIVESVRSRLGRTASEFIDKHELLKK